MEIREVVKNTNRNSGGVGLYRSQQNHHQQQQNHHQDPSTTTTTSAASPDFVLQWGNRKRLRCMKTQVKATDSSTERTTIRVDRRVARVEKDSIKNNFRRPFSPPQPSTTSHRILRNSEVMKGQQIMNGVVAGNVSFSPERRVGGGEEKTQDKKTTHNHNHNHNHQNNNNQQNVVAGASGSSETAEENKKTGGSSSGGSEAILPPPVWPPKFVIALTNKEKEEDFMAIKGSKLPQRPKKRAKFIQRTLNLVSPGAWLCDLTLERYEVREKKISKKRPRGLKAMGNMESDSE